MSYHSWALQDCHVDRAEGSGDGEQATWHEPASPGWSRSCRQEPEPRLEAASQWQKVRGGCGEAKVGKQVRDNVGGRDPDISSWISSWTEVLDVNCQKLSPSQFYHNQNNPTKPSYISPRPSPHSSNSLHQQVLININRLGDQGQGTISPPPLTRLPALTARLVGNYCFDGTLSRIDQWS